MGCPVGMSSSSYDRKVKKLTASMRAIWDDEVPSEWKKPVPKKLPNPDPTNFKIERMVRLGDFHLLLVHYPDCITFEGFKVLVYHKIDAKKLLAQKSLDPHFSKSKRFISPVARFEPTKRGSAMAESFCRNYHD